MQVETTVSLDIAVLEAVIESGGEEAQLALTRQLCALMTNEETPLAEREAVLPVLLKLAVDESGDVRSAIAAGLAGVKDLQPDLLFCIVAGEDENALPFLGQTPALNAWHMMAVLRVGDQARQCTVAARADLTAEAIAYIVKAGPSAAVATMMDNISVKLTHADMHVLYERLGQVGEVADRLLALPNLPLDLRITQAKRAAARMRQLMAERSWISSLDASEIVSAVLQVLSGAQTDDLLKALGFLAGKNQLTPALIIRAACLGEMRVVEASLAHLAGYAPARAANIMYARNGMRALVAKCGLPHTCTGLLVAFADVVMEARHEGLNLSRESFGRRLLEALMTRYENLSPHDRVRQIEYVSRFAEERARKIARQLKSDIQRAA
jgi:uncharacterized protein (DUF2336 family)